MITNEKFCQNVLSMLGQPYSQTDCIGLVRKAAGIRCQGTNWLWRSYNSSGKYKYLIQRMERAPTTTEIRNGMLVFRINWDKIPTGYNDKPDCHHVGVIIGQDVVQSNPKPGVYRERYTIDKWDGCGWLRFVDWPAPGRVPAGEQPTSTDPDEDEPLLDLPFVDPFENTTLEPTDHEMIKALYDHFIVD